MKIRISNIRLIPRTLAKLIMFGWVVAFILLCSNSFAQEIKATASLDSNTIKIGQQVQLKLSIKYRLDNGKQSKIQWPEITDTIRKEIEVVGQSKLDTIIPNKNNPTEFIQQDCFTLLTSASSKTKTETQFLPTWVLFEIWISN